MEIVLAIGHIAGAFTVSAAFGFLLMAVGTWDAERRKKSYFEELSIALGVPVDELEKEEHSERIIQYASQRFSNELLRNRLSDLCGSIGKAWTWLGVAAQVTVLGVVIWFTVTESLEHAVYAWWLLAVIVFFWVVTAAFDLACRLLMGRSPGQAREARKNLAELIKAKRASSA